MTKIEADLVLLNGNVITVDAKDSIVEGVAVIGDRLVKVGSTSEMKPLIGEKTRRVDLRGKTVVPGMMDTHVHLAGGADDFREVDVRTPPLKTLKEILQAIKNNVDKTEKGDWVVGGGSFSADFYIAEKRYPNKWELDRIAPDNPVAIRFGAHITVANSMAMHLAEVNSDTPDPAGGTIVKDEETGEPTGLLKEKAGTLVKRIIPPPTIKEMKEGIKIVCERMVSEGLTTVHNMCSSRDEIHALQQLKEEGGLPLRVLLSLRIWGSDFTLDMLKDLGLMNNFGDDWLKVSGIKMSIDGGMTGRNAALYEPYVNEPENYGLIRIPQNQLNSFVLEGQRAGLRSFIHAIGDKATDMALKSIENALEKMPLKDHRHRIEHGGNNWNTPDRLEKVKKLGIINATNPAFIWNLADSYEAFLGKDRMINAFMFRTLLDKGIKIVGSSDGGGRAGVSPTNPILGIYCCVTRRSMLGNVHNPEERLTPIEALRVYTIDNAYSGFEEDIKGSLEPGKLADMVVLDKDVLTAAPEEIKNIKVDMTIIGGKIVYSRDN